MHQENQQQSKCHLFLTLLSCLLYIREIIPQRLSKTINQYIFHNTFWMDFLFECIKCMRIPKNYALIFLYSIDRSNSYTDSEIKLNCCCCQSMTRRICFENKCINLFFQKMVIGTAATKSSNRAEPIFLIIAIPNCSNTISHNTTD